MLMAITRGVSPRLRECELTHLERKTIDVALAAEQHKRYEDALAGLGARVISLPALAEHPDCVFVEDPAIVLDEIAVICRPGAASRRGEAKSLADALAPFRELRRIQEPATIEGGDVMRAGRILYVGMSQRTNAEGARQLGEAVEAFGYRVAPVIVGGCLHLKSACCWLRDGRILANPEWVDVSAFDGFEIVDVPASEARCANVLRIRDTVVVAASFPRTREVLDGLGYLTAAVDVSELQKAEAGVTCTSLILEG
jgi:dimethylargininase